VRVAGGRLAQITPNLRPFLILNSHNLSINIQNNMQEFTFSALQREEYFDRLSSQEFDILVIGGGITGAGIALDAATRGLRVALVEKNDFAWGTSSRSTKLIHGGLRYLKQLEIRLVREVGLERAIVHHNARHVVLPERMLLPIVEGGSLGKTMSSLGLWVYDYLANVEKQERRKMLSKTETEAAEPLLRTDILKAGGLYYEYRTDDARLTIETLKTAVAHGALALNYCQAAAFDFSENPPENEASGARAQTTVRDTISQKEYLIKSKYVVNAAGPWVDTLRAIDTDGVKGHRLHLTKGVHIVVPRERLNLQQSAYFDVLPDKRMCFAIPRQGVTYIGTTDTNYTGDVNTPQAEYADVAYILEATNAMFPDVKLTANDVISTWAGLRPLVHQDGKSPSELSRKDEIFVSTSGLISIAGGKLTGYRKMAERVVDLVCKKMKRSRVCITANLRVAGAEFDSSEEFDHFLNLRAQSLKDMGIAPAVVIALGQRYGSNLDWIIEKAYALSSETESRADALLLAEIQYSSAFEMVQTLSDFLIRRTGRLYFERPTISQNYEHIADLMGQTLQWSAAQKAEYLADFQTEFARVMAWQTANVAKADK
jgi:glycerol-3-phosphate dehydrogenase